MCTKTFTHYNTVRFLHTQYVTHFVNQCRCGRCAECIRQLRSEWQLRSYYQSLETFKYNGFILFDTLTYRDSDLTFFHQHYSRGWPSQYNFACFNQKDFVDFMKLLRQRLMLLGYDVKGRLKYLVAGEYGSRPDCTHRPHLHILLYVTFSIDPCFLSYLISDCWRYGRTDGCFYRGENYVISNNVFRHSDRSSLLTAQYVSKYIAKDLYVFRKLYGRVYRCFCETNPGWQRDYEQRLLFRRVVRQSLPFHLQSDGFGLSALQNQSLDDIIETNSLRMPLTSSGVVARIPLPQYYCRKLFQQAIYFEGRLTWIFTEKGKEYKKVQLKRQMANFKERVRSLVPFLSDGVLDGLASYNFLRRGVLMPIYMKNYSDDDIINELLDSSRWSVMRNDRTCIIRSFLSERYGYLPCGKFLSQGVQLDPVYGQQLVCQGKHPLVKHWTVFEFLQDPPDGMCIGYDQYYEDLLALVYRYNYDRGLRDDNEQYLRDEQYDRYKRLGLVSV